MVLEFFFFIAVTQSYTVHVIASYLVYPSLVCSGSVVGPIRWDSLSTVEVNLQELSRYLAGSKLSTVTDFLLESGGVYLSQLRDTFSDTVRQKSPWEC